MSGPQAVRLADIKSLTLHRGRKTTANRVSAIDQIACVGGGARGLYEIDTLRCENSRAHADEDPEWSCKATLPPEFRLGGTEVICEGFSEPDDPYILKGSCGVQYRLLLTEIGEQRFRDHATDFSRNSSRDLFPILFWCIFLGVFAWIVYSAFFQDRPRVHRDSGPPPHDGDDWGGNDDDFGGFHARPSGAARIVNDSWLTRFGIGAAGATGLGLLARQRGQEQSSNRMSRPYTSPNFDSGAAHQSTGFGGTSRR